MTRKRHIVIVDDEPNIGRSLRLILEGEGYRVSVFESIAAVTAERPRAIADVYLLDVRLPDGSGIELLRLVRQWEDRSAAVMISGHGTVADAVEATRIGAFDFLEKPLARDRVLLVVKNALAWSDLQRENQRYRELVGDAPRMIGSASAFQHAVQQATQVARSDVTVLLSGESGTGKELLAKEIHERGRRSRRPFVQVNCSAIPREMFESEFFGHVRGAFTGALRDRPGRFQIADGGTIFLDEIGDLPLDLQPKLLRVLQEGEYERVGEDITRNVDVRVIAATNRNLAEQVDAHQFRQDLFYRLNVFPLELPPLRTRKSDIPLLAAHTIAEVSKRHGTSAPPLTQEDARWLQQYEWPGNIRELQNVIERAVILSKGGRLRLDIALPRAAHATVVANSPSPVVPEDVILTDRECRDRERMNLMKALERADGRIYGQGGAAELLGVNPTTLASRLRALKIKTNKAR